MNLSNMNVEELKRELDITENQIQQLEQNKRLIQNELKERSKNDKPYLVTVYINNYSGRKQRRFKTAKAAENFMMKNCVQTAYNENSRNLGAVLSLVDNENKESGKFLKVAYPIPMGENGVINSKDILRAYNRIMNTYENNQRGNRAIESEFNTQFSSDNEIQSDKMCKAIEEIAQKLQKDYFSNVTVEEQWKPSFMEENVNAVEGILGLLERDIQWSKKLSNNVGFLFNEEKSSAFVYANIQN